MSPWKAALFLILACAPEARAASCYPKQDLGQISDAVMACEKQIGEASDGLSSSDPAVRKQAVQKVNSALGVMRYEETLLRSMPPSKAVSDNLAQIADVRDIHKDEIQSANAGGPAGGDASTPKTTPAGVPKTQPKDGTAGTGEGAAGGGGAGGSGGPGEVGGSGHGLPDGAIEAAQAAQQNGPEVASAQADGLGGAPSNAGTSHAAALGEALKAGMAQDAGGLTGGSGSAGAMGTPRGNTGFFGGSFGGGARGGTLDQNLQAAAATGYAASFKSLGLQMGTGSKAGQVLRADGSPASAAEIASLQQRIASDPQALLRRPDFFDVIPRDQYGKLKGDYGARPDQREDAFKHVGVTKDERDFVHTQSCDKDLESGCNKHTKTKRYRQGDFVSPEDLKAIDEALHPEDANASAGSPAAAYDGASPEPKAELAASVPAASAPLTVSGMAGRLSALFSRLTGRQDAAPAAEEAAAPGKPGEPARARVAHRPGAAPDVPPLYLGLGAAGLIAFGFAWLATRRRRGFMDR